MGKKRCRATTFYVAPGDKRAFADHAVWAVVAGELVRVKHRNDITAISEAHPDWDGLCAVSRRSHGDEVTFEGLVERHGASFHHLDGRVIDGRPPRTVAADLHRIATGAAADVDLRALTRSAIADGQVAGVVASNALRLATPVGRAQYLRFMVAAAPHLDRGPAAELAEYAANHQLGVPDLAWSRSTLHLGAFTRFTGPARLEALKVLWDDATLASGHQLLDVAVQTHYRLASTRWPARISALAAAHPDAWLAVFADWTANESHRGSLNLFDLDVAFLDRLARQNRGALAAVSVHPSGTADQLERLTRAHNWAQLIEPHLRNGVLDDQRASHLAEHLAGRMTRPGSVDEANFDFNCAALLAETDAAHGHLFVTAATRWLDRVRRSKYPETNSYTIHEVMHRNLQLTQDDAALLRKQLRRDDEGAEGTHDEALARLIGRSQHINAKFSARLTEQFPQRMYKTGTATDWSSIPTPLRPAQLAASAERGRYELSGGLLAAACDPSLDSEAAFLHQLAEARVPTDLSAQALGLWRVAHGVGSTRDADIALARHSAFGAVDVFAAVSAHGAELEPEVARRVHSGVWGTDPETCAAAALAGATTVDAVVSDFDPLADTADQVTAAAVVDVPWPARVTAGEQLPAMSDRPWDLDPEVVAAVNGNQIAAGQWGTLDVEVIENVAELRTNAAHMHNCTASYAGSVARGNTVMLALNGASGDTVVNVQLTNDGGRWRVDEIDSWANGGVPSDAEAAIRAHLGRALRRPVQRVS